jgi:hypothetical protein
MHLIEKYYMQRNPTRSSWLRYYAKSLEVIGSIPDERSLDFSIDLILPAAL